MPLGKSLDNILTDYFGQSDVNLQFDQKDSTVGKELGIAEIKIENIELSPFQTRSFFEEDKIKSLAENIRQQGLIQPVIVLQKKITESTEPHYVLLAGERRLRAVKYLGWETILAVVKTEDSLDEKQQAMISAMENLQREDLSPIELSQTFKMLILTQKIDEEKLASMLGASVQYVKNYLRLLTLSVPVREALLEKKIGEGQARYLVNLSEQEQYELLQLILDKEMTVKEIVAYLKDKKEVIPQPKVNGIGHSFPAEVINKADRFASQFPNSKLKCVGDLDKGKIVISWG
ncbi:MAG: ParB/RepB/Spo0J family partition protein [bacterium]